MTSLLALARIGDRQDRAAVVERVAQWWPLLHDEDLQLEALRSRGARLVPSRTALSGNHRTNYGACSMRPIRRSRQRSTANSPSFSSPCGAPGVVPRTLALVQQAATLEEQLFFIFHLRHVHEGWSAADREAYFRWFLQPQRAHPPEVKRWFTDLRLHYTDGASLPVYLANIRREAAATLDVAERREFAALIDAPLPSVVKPVETKPRKLVHEWTSTELLPLVEKLARPRSAERGREAFAAANCVACHRYANEGGAIGPDLTAVAYKLGAREMLESLIEPSKVVSDQFQNTIVELASGLTARRPHRRAWKREDRHFHRPLGGQPRGNLEIADRDDATLAHFADACRPAQHTHLGRDPRPARVSRLWRTMTPRPTGSIVDRPPLAALSLRWQSLLGQATQTQATQTRPAAQTRPSADALP